MIHVFTPTDTPVLRKPKNGSIGGRLGVSRLIHGISPCFTAVSANACHCGLLPPAVPIRSFLARFVASVATALPNAKPLAISLDVARPDQSAALRWLAACSVISSKAPGKSSFNISAVTPDNTASCEGYAGNPVSGIRDSIPESVMNGEGLL